SSGVVLNPVPRSITFQPSSGAEQLTYVTVYGRNFGTAPNSNIVTFGSDAPAYAVNATVVNPRDSRTLIVQVPAGAVTGSISVSANGYKGTSNNTFYVYPSPNRCASAAPALSTGSDPGSPGLWWNPNRLGTGWDLNFQSSSGSSTPP